MYEGEWALGKKHGWSIYTVDKGESFRQLESIACHLLGPSDSKTDGTLGRSMSPICPEHGGSLARPDLTCLSALFSQVCSLWANGLNPSRSGSSRFRDRKLLPCR